MTTELQDFLASHTRQLQIEIGAALITLCGPEPEEALPTLAHASALADSLEARLVAEGVDMNLGRKPEWFSLASLSAMSSPKAVALLAGIDALMLMARELDEERSSTLPGGYESTSGGGWGTEYAEALATLRIRLLSEISGTPGSGLE